MIDFNERILGDAKELALEMIKRGDTIAPIPFGSGELFISSKEDGFFWIQSIEVDGKEFFIGTPEG